VVLSLSLVGLCLVLAGCGGEAEDQWSRLGLPEPITEPGERIESLWMGAWLAAFIVGALVWGLIILSSIIHRRRPTDEGLPPQVRYNLPVEIIYTIAPIIVVLVFFFFTARDQDKILEVSNQPEHKIGVVGKRWSWDFNYLDAKVYETGTIRERPTLVLPVGEKIQFVVDSRDVIHSFWVPAFLFKLDAIPGKRNTFELTPKRTGTFAGKCAELCGTYHSRMLFDVRVVERAEYDRYLESLRTKGQVGELPANIGPAAQIGEGESVPGGSENRR
jgi:cytochrome c oxidase subunit 2